MKAATAEAVAEASAAAPAKVSNGAEQPPEQSARPTLEEKAPRGKELAAQSAPTPSSDVQVTKHRAGAAQGLKGTDEAPERAAEACAEALQAHSVHGTFTAGDPITLAADAV